jgi:hypothetical protein
MENGLYKSGRTAFATGNIKWRALGGDTIRCLLVTRAYTPDLKKHQTLSDIPVAARLGKDGNTEPETFPQLTLLSPEDGICDANDVDFGMIPSGNEIKGVVLYKDDAKNKGTVLIAFVGVNFITNGTQVIIGWDGGPDKIFRL